MKTWIERARWEWQGPNYLHECWIQAYVDDQTHEISSWCVSTRLGGPGSGPKKTHFRVEQLGAQEARDRAYESAAAYRMQFAGPAD